MVEFCVLKGRLQRRTDRVCYRQGRHPRDVMYMREERRVMQAEEEAHVGDDVGKSVDEGS